MNKRKTIAVKYHRNGISGEGFFTVRFTSPTEAKSHDLPRDAEFLAVVSSVYASDEPEVAKDARGIECYVVALGAPELCWRGDHFADWAVGECRRASEDMSAHHWGEPMQAALDRFMASVKP